MQSVPISSSTGTHGILPSDSLQMFSCRPRQADFVFESWKTWEHGAPDLAVEIVSPSDASDLEWQRKLERYQEAGVQELVRFDPNEEAGRRLRIWDRVRGDLVERVVEGDSDRCDALSLTWVIRTDAQLGTMLRLARDSRGADLLPTLTEERERERKLREDERKLREEAERRVKELEAELRRLKGDV